MSTSNFHGEQIVVNDSVGMKVDVTNCDQEPIHIPGLIQPHGVLFTLTEPNLTIVQVSNNTQALLGIEPEHLLNQELAHIVQASLVEQIQHGLKQDQLATINPLQVTMQVAHQRLAFDGIVHRVPHAPGLVLLELEPVNMDEGVALPSFYSVMHSSTAVLQGASNLHTLCQSAAQMVRTLTGFDRIMIYRFHEDWHGEVIAEDKAEHLEPYLGLHYPASDIPKQARELYLHNWLRLIANVHYTPAPIIPTVNPVTQRSLDLSASVLRSVSPMHIQYLKNMGVGASMSVSLIKNGQLWGLISCHHERAKYVPYTIRMACEFLGQLLSLQISAREEVDDYAYNMKLKDIQARLSEHLMQYESVLEGLQQHSSLLLDLVGARGVALCFDDDYLPFGEAPDKADGLALLEWLKHNHAEELFATEELPVLWPEATRLKEVANGLLAIAISPLPGAYILWFRPETIRVVTWGGDPNKPVEQQNGAAFLHPRTSFAAWSETVRLKALPWKPNELDAVRTLRSTIIDRVLRNLLAKRSEELADLNQKLVESNNELDSFAYIVSHDLKEPLRGINNYVHILREDYSNVLDESGLFRLNTLARLTQRLDHLIDSLLHYSRVGRVDLAFAETDLNEVLERVLDLLKARLEEANIEIRIPRPLPTIHCDRARIGEVFSNLITNATKYNDKQHKWIEIGYLENPAEPYTFYVRDNGIGIRDKYFDSVFRIFKRLHGRDKFGGGTGAGLTIVKRIIERHAGKIWLESTYGEGTTFYFTLQER